MIAQQWNVVKFATFFFGDHNGINYIHRLMWLIFTEVSCRGFVECVESCCPEIGSVLAVSNNLTSLPRHSSTIHVPWLLQCSDEIKECGEKWNTIPI